MSQGVSLNLGPVSAACGRQLHWVECSGRFCHSGCVGVQPVRAGFVPRPPPRHGPSEKRLKATSERSSSDSALQRLSGSRSPESGSEGAPKQATAASRHLLLSCSLPLSLSQLSSIDPKWTGVYRPHGECVHPGRCVGSVFAVCLRATVILFRIT